MSQENNIYLSVIIPAYNEEKRINTTLEKIINCLNNRKYTYEIVIVDDGSNDKTVDIATKYNIKILKNNKNYGKGYSVKRGVLQAKGNYILFTDCDLSTPIEEIEKLIKYLENNYDIAIASRYLKESLINQTLKRKLIGRIFNLVVKMLLIKDIKDTQCGFKVFKKDVAKDIFSKCKINGFAFDVEVLYLAKKLNYKIKEVPVRWNESKGSSINLFKHAPQMLKDLFRIKKYHKCI